MAQFLPASICAPADKDEHDKDVTAIEQYQEKLKTYQVWFKRDRFARYTLLSCMRDDLLREFKHSPTDKDL